MMTRRQSAMGLLLGIAPRLGQWPDFFGRAVPDVGSPAKLQQAFSDGGAHQTKTDDADVGIVVGKHPEDLLKVCASAGWPAVQQFGIVANVRAGAIWVRVPRVPGVLILTTVCRTGRLASGFGRIHRNHLAFAEIADRYRRGCG